MIGGRILKNWEECIGVLHHLSLDEGNLVGEIGRLSILLPSEMEDELRPMVGQKIAILRTDSITQPYRIRLPSGDGRRS